MRKFDELYENFIWNLREDVQASDYVASNFVDDLKSLVKVLVDNDYLKGNPENIVAHLVQTRNPVKELNLDLKDGAIPPIKLKIKGGEKPAESQEDEDFSVTVIPIEKPEQQKEFTNTMLETIFADVLAFVKTLSLQGLKPEAGVETVPPAEGANAQPGEQGGASALPGVQ